MLEANPTGDDARAKLREAGRRAAVIRRTGVHLVERGCRRRKHRDWMVGSAPTRHPFLGQRSGGRDSTPDRGLADRPAGLR